MNIAILTAAYPPMKNSGAIQVRDLAQGLAVNDCVPIIIFPDATINNHIQIEKNFGVFEVRVKFPELRDQNKVSRTILEFIMPYFVWRQLKNFKEFTFHIDGIACYAPSIFFAPLITNLKKK